MTTDLDEELRQCLERKTLDVEIPPADVAKLIVRGRRARKVRIAIVAPSAAAALVLVAAVAISDQSSDISDRIATPPGHIATPPGKVIVRSVTPSSTPKNYGIGAPIVTHGATGPSAVPGPRAVFYTRGVMYVGGHRVRADIPWYTGAHVSQRGIAFPGGPTYRPSLITNDGRLERLAPARPMYGDSYSSWVAADSDSRLVAWTENGKRTAQIVAYDVVRHRVIGDKTVECNLVRTADPCPWPYIADSGLVFIDSGSGSTAWNPRTGETTQLTGLPGQAHRKVIDFFGGGSVDISGLGPGWVQLDLRGLLSYDGNWVLDGESSTLIRDRLHPEQTIRFRPPGSVAASQFDTDGSLLVVTTDEGGTTYSGWDCGLTGPCKRMVGPTSHEIRLVAWDT